MGTVRIRVLDYESIPGTLIELQILVNNALNSVPHEYRDKVEMETPWDAPSLVASYERPETEEERGAREQASARYRAEDEERERRQLARLKEKYEGGGRPPFVMK